MSTQTQDPGAPDPELVARALTLTDMIDGEAEAGEEAGRLTRKEGKGDIVP